jgi:dTDP-4-amino-4,6-dideoxygalactose transaminase
MSNKRNIYLCLAHMGGNETKYIQEAFDTNWVAPLGPNVNAFEVALEHFVGGNKKVVALASGTAAVHLSMVALGVSPGDEVICQSFTFAASCNPATYLGATPVFVGSEDKTWNMDPAKLEDAILDRIKKTGRKPKVIVPVYMYGMPAYIDEIMEIANRFEIPVVEDSAEAFGSLYKGRMTGTIGRFGIMSFNGNKMITTSGGGALICPDEETKRKIMFYATQAREDKPYYLHREIGFNYRLSNVCAGIGRGQMEVVDDHIRHHRHIADLYAAAFQDMEEIQFHREPESYMEPNYWLSTITFEGKDCKPKVTGQGCEPCEQVMRTMHALAAENIESRPLWKPMHTQPVYKDAPAYVDGTSELLFSKGLCLPSGPLVTDEDVEHIIKIIKESIK